MELQSNSQRELVHMYTLFNFSSPHTLYLLIYLFNQQLEKIFFHDESKEKKI